MFFTNRKGRPTADWNGRANRTEIIRQGLVARGV
jgi:hypothetical protein